MSLSPEYPFKEFFLAKAPVGLLTKTHTPPLILSYGHFPALPPPVAHDVLPEVPGPQHCGHVPGLVHIPVQSLLV